jgi:hypothetical protein
MWDMKSIMKKLSDIYAEMSFENECDSEIVIPWLKSLGFMVEDRELLLSDAWNLK